MKDTPQVHGKSTPNQLTQILKVVEAAGVEPASENVVAKRLHA